MIDINTSFSLHHITGITMFVVARHGKNMKKLADFPGRCSRSFLKRLNFAPHLPPAASRGLPRPH